MGKTDFLTRDEVRGAYDRNAKFYDFGVLLYCLVGIRINLWRRLILEALDLRSGDTVVEIGCGTGLNFARLEEKIGKTGRIVGVDFSEAMLAKARALIKAEGWDNIELVHCSAADYQFPDRVDGVLATGVLTYEPDYDKVIERGTKALTSGRHWVVLDYKMPTNWLRHIAPFMVSLWSPFGVSVAQMSRHPWESVQRHLRNTKMRELYGGFVYIASGEAP